MEIPAGALEEEEKGRGGEDEGVGRRKGGWGGRGVDRELLQISTQHRGRRWLDQGHWGSQDLNHGHKTLSTEQTLNTDKLLSLTLGGPERTQGPELRPRKDGGRLGSTVRQGQKWSQGKPISDPLPSEGLVLGSSPRSAVHNNSLG